MMLGCVACLAGTAWAGSEGLATVQIEVVHALGQEHPWGARLGANYQFAPGKGAVDAHTDPNAVLPLVGPSFGIAWRGGPRFAFDVLAEGGVGGIEAWDQGYLPRWQLVARAGLHFEVSRPAAGIQLGGFVSKSISVEVPDFQGSTNTFGANGIGVRFDADAPWMFGGERWRRPVLGAGVWMYASPVSNEYLL